MKGVVRAPPPEAVEAAEAGADVPRDGGNAAGAATACAFARAAAAALPPGRGRPQVSTERTSS